MTPKTTSKQKLSDAPERQAALSSAKEGALAQTSANIPTQIVGEGDHENTGIGDTKVRTLVPTSEKGSVTDPKKKPNGKSGCRKTTRGPDEKSRQASGMFEKPPRKRSSPTPRRGEEKKTRESAPKKKERGKAFKAKKDLQRAHGTSKRDVKKAREAPKQEKKREKKKKIRKRTGPLFINDLC